VETTETLETVETTETGETIEAAEAIETVETLKTEDRSRHTQKVRLVMASKTYTKGTVGDGTLGTSSGYYFEHSVFL